MRAVRFVLQALLGLIFGAGVALAVSPAIASFGGLDPEGSRMATATFIIVGLTALLVAFAPTARRAFGRGFLSLGAAVFLLPLSALMLSGAAFNATITAESSGAEMLGAGLAGGVITGAASFLGFILGSVLLLAGLILSLGGRREVIVHEPRAKATASSERREPPVLRQ